MAARGLVGFPVPGRPLLSQRPILGHTMCSYLSEQTCLFYRAVGRFLAQAVTARPWPTPRSTSSLARDSISFERERTNFSSVSGRCLFCRWWRLGAMTGRDTKIKSSRLSRTARRTTPRADSLCLWGEAGAWWHGGWPFLRSRHDDTRQRRGKLQTEIVTFLRLSLSFSGALRAGQRMSPFPAK
jgi:hypothetical protein